MFNGTLNGWRDTLYVWWDTLYVWMVGHTAMFGWRTCFVGMMGHTVCLVGANRLLSTIVGNREMDQLYMTSQVSNFTRKKQNVLTLVDMFSKIKSKSLKIENNQHKIALITYFTVR